MRSADSGTAIKASKATQIPIVVFAIIALFPVFRPVRYNVLAMRRERAPAECDLAADVKVAWNRGNPAAARIPGSSDYSRAAREAGHRPATAVRSLPLALTQRRPGCRGWKALNWHTPGSPFGKPRTGPQGSHFGPPRFQEAENRRNLPPTR